MSNVRRQLESWLSKIDIKGSVIDIGGYGRPRGYKILDYKGGDYIYDLNYEIPEISQFDTALCLEVMEYIWNPVQALKNINKLLKPGGLLYISFHFLFPHHHPKFKDYLRYTKPGIEKLMKETGFTIQEIIPRKARTGKLIEFCREESKIVNCPGDVGYMICAKKHAIRNL